MNSTMVRIDWLRRRWMVGWTTSRSDWAELWQRAAVMVSVRRDVVAAIIPVHQDVASAAEDDRVKALLPGLHNKLKMYTVTPHVPLFCTKLNGLQQDFFLNNLNRLITILNSAANVCPSYFRLKPHSSSPILCGHACINQVTAPKRLWVRIRVADTQPMC